MTVARQAAVNAAMNGDQSGYNEAMKKVDYFTARLEVLKNQGLKVDGLPSHDEVIIMDSTVNDEFKATRARLSAELLKVLAGGETIVQQLRDLDQDYEDFLRQFRHVGADPAVDVKIQRYESFTKYVNWDNLMQQLKTNAAT